MPDSGPAAARRVQVPSGPVRVSFASPAPNRKRPRVPIVLTFAPAIGRPVVASTTSSWTTRPPALASFSASRRSGARAYQSATSASSVTSTIGAIESERRAGSARRGSSRLMAGKTVALRASAKQHDRSFGAQAPSPCRIEHGIEPAPPGALFRTREPGHRLKGEGAVGGPVVTADEADHAVGAWRDRDEVSIAVLRRLAGIQRAREPPTVGHHEGPPLDVPAGTRGDRHGRVRVRAHTDVVECRLGTEESVLEVEDERRTQVRR